MSKSIQDYRNIVKILKLQLLKVRQENSSLSNQMGIISQFETSSYTRKLNCYKQSTEPFAQKVVVFLQFAHRCQLVGITPEMVFRITDKKRDKNVNTKNLAEVMKRVKINLSEDHTNKFLGALMRRGNSIQYEQYLQCISAFQINSQKFPFQSSRTYVQLCLIQFGKICQSRFSTARKLFQQIKYPNNGSYFKFDNFLAFCSKECKKLAQTQIVAIFLGLDIQSCCQIQQDIFEREIQKLYRLIQKGGIDEKISRSTLSKAKPKKKIQKDEDVLSEQFQELQQGGVQGFKKQKNPPAPKKTQTKHQSKLSKQNQKDIQGKLNKNGVTYAKLAQTLLQRQKDIKNIYLRSFSLNDINGALKQLVPNFPKKVMLQIFKLLDKDSNGSTNTQQITKLLLRTQSGRLDTNPQLLFALLYRHLRQIQYPQPLLRFTSLGYQASQLVKQQHLKMAFDKLDLTQEEYQYMYPVLVKGNNVTMAKFCQLLKQQASVGDKNKFQKMAKSDFDELGKMLSGINKSRKGNKKSNFRKLIRLDDLKEQQGSGEWESIFQNEWDCFQYCLNTASKLQKNWRDPQFGPTKSDKHGLKSIFGNQNLKPPGIPEEEEDIIWLTYGEITTRKNQNTPSKFMSGNLLSTDVVQGNLGDCWYISALSIITLNDQYIKGKPLKQCERNPQYLIYGIHPQLFQFFVKYGLYVFKFFKKFKPVYVVVDQLFPVQSSTNDLIFAKSPENSLQWVSYSEKAYAKLHHAYTNMISGDIAQGLNDLTNSLPVKLNLVLESQQNIDRIKSLSGEGQLMGCSIKQAKASGSMRQPPVLFDQQKCGLHAGHAYSIIDYIDVPTNQGVTFQLIRVRNPWGNSEWILDWSDNSLNQDPKNSLLSKHKNDLQRRYEQKIKKAIKQKKELPVPYNPGQDGQFLMDIEDWNKIFNNLFIGFSQSYKIAQKGWRATDTWDQRKPSGLCKSKNASPQQEERFVKNNYQYILQIQEDKTEVLMLLIQEDGRLYRGQKYPYKQIVNAAILLVFKLDSNQSQLRSYDKKKLYQPKSLTLEVRRDVDCWAQFQKGRYAVLPCKKQNQIKKTQFQFRVYSDKNISVKRSKQTKNLEPINQKAQFVDKSLVKDVIRYLQSNNPKYQSS